MRPRGNTSLKSGWENEGKEIDDAKIKSEILKRYIFKKAVLNCCKEEEVWTFIPERRISKRERTEA